MLGNSFFITNSSNPNTPAETWTLVYSKTTGGNYSYSAGWGKYKIVISGGGGAGATFLREVQASSLIFNQNGYAGQEQTISLNVTHNNTKYLSGIIGIGGGGGSIYISKFIDGQWNVPTMTASFGAIGTGYGNGNISNKYERPRAQLQSWGMVGGTGGGSSSLLVDSVLTLVSKGGDGGSSRINDGGYRDCIGGTGGSGGTQVGTGASGGTAAYWIGYNNHGEYTVSSQGGSNGYIHIYKSNLKPEIL